MTVVKVTRHVRPEHICVNLLARTKDDAVRELAALVAASGALSESSALALAQAVMGREGEGTTGIGGGVAVPHAKTQLVKELVVAVGVSERGIDFSSVDGDPVHVVFLIASPPDASAEYLALMRWVVTLTRSKYWMKLVRSCTTGEALVEVLDESDVGAAGR